MPVGVVAVGTVFVDVVSGLLPPPQAAKASGISVIASVLSIEFHIDVKLKKVLIPET